ncbi:hypothetical protein V6N13_001990 [Hibiscus sabdariffa]|uniref:Uncharacterized protein n=2 Tax=Hibiscus sabdariffa TaxID=183260 RepID=A0ABR1ZRE9_9ROSI
MNESDISKQIQQMVRFVRQETEEKANEISVSAEEVFNIEKLQLVEAKKKIRQENAYVSILYPMIIAIIVSTSIPSQSSLNPLKGDLQDEPDSAHGPVEQPY